jgi:hypothetical protein
MRAKAFLQVCVGVLLLAVAVVASRVHGQVSPSGRLMQLLPPEGNYCLAVTEAGDVFGGTVYFQPTWQVPQPFHYVGNIFAGPVQVDGRSLSRVKRLYQK